MSLATNLDSTIDKHERSACGVGVVASLTGESSHQIIEQGLEAAAAMPYRAGTGSDVELGPDGTDIGTSDGVGVITQIPQDLFKEFYAEEGGQPLADGQDLGVGVFFLPRDDEQARKNIQQIIEEELSEFGYETGQVDKGCIWRDVPDDETQVGAIGRTGLPHVAQLLIPQDSAQDKQTFNRNLYVLRRRIENRMKTAGMTTDDCYMPSFSGDTIVYKGLCLPHRLGALYPDLLNKEYKSPVIGLHDRFSTNTAPAPWRAHFKRLLAHNGEINTLKGNVNNMFRLERLFRDAFGNHADEVWNDVLNTDGADSDVLDNAADVLYQAGITLPLVKTLLIPPAQRPGAEMSYEEQRLNEFGAAVSPGWEGPGMFVMVDGKMALIGGDLNGMRPTPYEIFGTEENPRTPAVLVAGSEFGMVGSLSKRQHLAI